MNIQKDLAKVVHIEVCLNKNASVKTFTSWQAPVNDLKSYLEKQCPEFNRTIALREEDHPTLGLVQSIYIESEQERKHGKLLPQDIEHLVFHVYVPRWFAMETENLEQAECDDSEEMIPSSQHWILPHNEFTTLWENLVYEPGLKEKLFKFALSALQFSKHKVNTNIISCNRLLLLHGPPGTGKTSLCKALAQKIAIRTTGKEYSNVHLIEINSHSLFSKWFSESGKLVMRLFAKIREIMTDPNLLVCVLIDEVESLAYARDNMAQEPKDAIRVVNALLTQLDSIKESPNVLVLATSNLASTIDLAFLDRADIKQYIGLPSVEAIRKIYEGMLMEMMRVGFVHKEVIVPGDESDELLSELSRRSVGVSGRTLRKLPFLAHVKYCMSEKYSPDGTMKVWDYLDSLALALDEERKDKAIMLDSKKIKQ